MGLFPHKKNPIHKMQKVMGMKAAAPKAEQPPPTPTPLPPSSTQPPPSAEKYLTAAPSPAVGSPSALPPTDDTLEESSAAKLQAVQRGRSARREAEEAEEAVASVLERGREAYRSRAQLNVEAAAPAPAGEVPVTLVQSWFSGFSLGGQSLEEIPVDGAAPPPAPPGLLARGLSVFGAALSPSKSPAAPAAAPPPATVDKAGYSAWEAEVIAAFFTRSHERTPLMPTDGAPVHLRKEKYILVADASTSSGNPLSAEVAAGASWALPAQTYVQLHHLGKGEADGVRFGYEAAAGVFKHPAIDVGGLTNLRQKLGERPAFEEASTKWGPNASADIDDVARVLLFQWNALAKEEFEPPKASARNSAQFGALL